MSSTGAINSAVMLVSFMNMRALFRETKTTRLNIGTTLRWRVESWMLGPACC